VATAFRDVVAFRMPGLECEQAQVSAGIFGGLSMKGQLERLPAKFVGAESPCPSPQGGTQ
jgi:hypothetical protein